MTWFWRATIAVGCGFAVGAGIQFAIFNSALMTEVMQSAFRLLAHEADTSSWRTAFALALLYVLPALLVCLVAYSVLSPRGASRLASETRCRKCAYILPGISEPRCPECGERI
jgi:hypothetical protein